MQFLSFQNSFDSEQVKKYQSSPRVKINWKISKQRHALLFSLFSFRRCIVVLCMDPGQGVFGGGEKEK